MIFLNDTIFYSVLFAIGYWKLANGFFYSAAPATFNLEAYWCNYIGWLKYWPGIIDWSHNVTDCGEMTDVKRVLVKNFIQSILRYRTIYCSGSEVILLWRLEITVLKCLALIIDEALDTLSVGLYVGDCPRVGCPSDYCDLFSFYSDCVVYSC